MLLLISASPITKRTFPHLQSECKQLSPTYEYSPEHAISLLSEGEAPLLESASETTEVITSPPFVRAPIEDRSKYEKLTGSLDDLSSDSDANSESDNFSKTDRIKKRIATRNIKNIPEKLHAAVISKVDIPLVKNLTNKSNKTKKLKTIEATGSNKQHQVGYDSDDSIGSASDLRANEDVLEENEDRKGDEISETISESIRTCGSSAYHAECESMATREDDAISRAVRMKRAIQTAQQERLAASQINEEQASMNEDLLFVGHQYGDKPLLLDDELDSDCELKLDNSQWSIEKKIHPNPKDIWIEPKSFEESDDVFAKAPFPKISKSKKKQIRTSSPLADLKEESGRNTSENIFDEITPKSSASQSPLLLLSPPTVSILNTGQSDHIDNEQNLISPSNSFEFTSSNSSNNPFAPANNIIQSCSSYGVVTVNSNILNINVVDTSPFEMNQFEVSFPPFINPETPSTVESIADFSTCNNFYHPFQPTTTYCDNNLCDNGQAIYENVTLPNAFNDTNSDFAFIRSTQIEPNKVSEIKNIHLASIATPLAPFNSTILTKPTTLDLNHKIEVLQDTEDLITPLNDDASSYYKLPADYRGQDVKKDRKGKSKYQLIETDVSDNHLDELPGKNSYKLGKSNQKKANSKNKKTSSKQKTPVAFSNMSFEDFPSDDTEQVSNLSTPFEVIRKSFDEDKKFGSLKRRSNPFS